MDNKENTAPAQTESGKFYTIDELLARMEPQYRAYKNTIRGCIVSLTLHAAQLSAQGQEEQLPTFRRMIVEMAEFWGLTKDDTPKGYQEIAERYGGIFDCAVSAARDSGRAPELNGQAKEDILAGLELYAQEMRINDAGLEQWAVECGDYYAALNVIGEYVNITGPEECGMEMGGM